MQAGSWQEVWALTEKLAQAFIQQLFKSLGNSSQTPPSQGWSRQRIWLMGLTGLVLWMLNWRLVLAMAAGLGSFKALSRLSQKQGPPSNLKFLSGLNSVNQSLSAPLADSSPWGVISGGILAACGTYLAASILMESDSYWIAAGGILQGLITVAIFCLLIWQISHRHSSPSFDLDQRLRELTDADPLTRLMAVRQMTRLATQTESGQLYLPEVQLSLRSHLTDCFRLMLRQEPDAIVRAAVRESLSLVSPKPQLPKGAQPLATPVALQRSASHLHRHPVEYVEP